MNEQQIEKMRSGTGFVAALDQSGGSTPKALRLYGVEDDAYASEEGMFDLVHRMRARIMTSPAFTGEHILGTILFENTMDREVEGRPTAEYLWDVKTIVPILKVDKGLDAETDGARMMKPMPGLDDLLARAAEKGIFATKMRSVVCGPGAGLDAVVDQQLQVAHRIIKAGLVPIIEPEVEIRCPEKEAAEDQLHAGLLAHAERLGPDEFIMLKLTPPERDDLYADLVAHPQVLRVLFLSGGYSRDEACERLGSNHGCVASFSRALTEGLRAEMSPEEFDAALAASIAQIAAASAT